MKKLLLVVGALVVLFACSKEDGFYEDGDLCANDARTDSASQNDPWNFKPYIIDDTLFYFDENGELLTDSFRLYTEEELRSYLVGKEWLEIDTFYEILSDGRLLVDSRYRWLGFTPLHSYFSEDSVYTEVGVLTGHEYVSSKKLEFIPNSPRPIKDYYLIYSVTENELKVLGGVYNAKRGNFYKMYVLHPVAEKTYFWVPKNSNSGGGDSDPSHFGGRDDDDKF